MRIAGNKLLHLRDFFHKELKEMYPESEIQALFREAAMHYLGYTATEVLTKNEENLNQSDLLKLYDCAKALKTGKPIQYILKTAWFMGLAFEVNPSVLIPRPETEELIELILKNHARIFSLLDACTGSGCIPISIAKNRKLNHVAGFDVSEQALKTAEINNLRHQANVHFFQGDLLNMSALKKQITQQYDVIVSNPPYIKASERNEMSPNVLDHEPVLALFVEGEDAIIFYRRLIDLSADVLQPGGHLYFELNPHTAEEVAQCARQSGIFKTVEIIKDLSGKDRFLSAQKNPKEN